MRAFSGTRTSLWMTATAVLAILTDGCRQPSSEAPPGEFFRWINLGKAHLENRSAKGAIDSFTAALDVETTAALQDLALRNLARAFFLARDDAAALRALERVTEESNKVATHYLKGLAYAHQGLFEEALPFLEDAVRLDPHTAALRFQLAGAYQALGELEAAVEQLRATVELDPLHTGAHYRLAFHARSSGDRAQLEKHQRELTRLRRVLGEDNRAPEVLEKCVYTQAETVPVATAAPPAGLEVRFADVTDEMPASKDDQAVLRATVAATVLEVDKAGRPSLLLVGSEGLDLIAVSEAGGVERTRIFLKPDSEKFPAEGEIARGLRALSGNFYDDVAPGTRYEPALHARNDVLILGPGGLRLLERRADHFEEVTTRAGLAGLAGHRGRWVDYENDGDLDLLIAGEAGLSLFQNNGDGRFEEVSGVLGADAEAPLWDVAAADLDGDLAVDLVAARGPLETMVFENLRTGGFRVRPDPPGPWPAARRVLLNELDGDAHPDTVLLGAEGVMIVPGRSPDRQRLDLGGLEPEAAVLFDFDNDGRLDLAVAVREAGRSTSGKLRLWRNEGSGTWSEATQAAGLAAVDLSRVDDLLAADVDTDGDTDLLAVTGRGLRILRNEGGNARAQLKIRLAGTKTNPTGLGARVEVRRGSFHRSRIVAELPVEIGLGTHRTLDSVRVLWTNGIVDHKIDVQTASGPLYLLEKNVAAGSCPFLYAWDGDGYRFVTDILGNSPVGLSLRRGVALDADPDELVRLGDPSDFVPRDGAYLVEVTEEMREVLYLDHARLVVVDHVPEVEVHATDKLMPAPFPPSELVPLAALRPPEEVLSDDGVERGEALAALDGVFAPPGALLPPPFRGMTRPLKLTLDFGPLDTSLPLVLALSGWLQYGDASTNIALSQGPPERVVPPRLEAEIEGGRWREVDVVVGMPAGKTKTILVDLAGKLPRETRRLRLVSSFEIRWDRIALGERLPAQAAVWHSMLPAQARLAWRGFSEIRARAPGHPTTPDYDNVAPRPPWLTALQGWATRYGDVLELVRERDERLVVVSAGDTLELHFDASALPPLAPGRARTFFFYSVGWDKDGDLNVIGGDRIEPMPVAASGDWQERYNTRRVPWNRFDYGTE